MLRATFLSRCTWAVSQVWSELAVVVVGGFVGLTA